jgi:hypothetical protein
MLRQIGDRTYNIGKSKTTGKYKIFQLCKKTWFDIYETDNLDNLKKEVKRLKKLADKREARQMIADICGTSYSAACKDMGISKL